MVVGVFLGVVFGGGGGDEITTSVLQRGKQEEDGECVATVDEMVKKIGELVINVVLVGAEHQYSVKVSIDKSHCDA